MQGCAIQIPVMLLICFISVRSMRPVILESMAILHHTDYGKHLVDLVRRMAQWNASRKAPGECVYSVA